MVPEENQMRFKKGDLLTTMTTQSQGPLARVVKVTRAGVVHCVNLVACATMEEGDVFQFTPDEGTRYIVRSRK
jgi:hypothetical protein